MNFEKKLLKYSHYLDEINKKAYKNVYLLSNPTLSKNPYTKTRFLQNLLEEKKEYNSFIKASILFYVKNILLFGTFFVLFVYAKATAKKKQKSFQNNELVFIDSFYGESELGNGTFKYDEYFAKLYEYMNKKGIEYLIAPKLYGFKNPLKYIKFLRIVEKSSQNVHVDISMLSLSDVFSIIAFILHYPLHVWKLRNSVKEESTIDTLFREDLAYSLSGTDFYPFVRYLYAKQLGKMYASHEIKVISWCEYQVNEKNFFKGLRETHNDVHIYATQFLFKFPSYVALYIPESDKALSIAPDTILVTGKYYVPEQSVYKYKVGPAFRYEKLYSTPYVLHPENTNIVVMLPYVQEDAFHVIELLKTSKQFVGMSIDFKIHPDFAGEKENYEKNLAPTWKIIDIYPDLEQYGFVISSGSGSVMELACVGMSVLMIASKGAFTTNPMPREGQDENWSLIATTKELEESYKKLILIRKEKPEQFKNNVHFYRENFLSEVSDEKIKEHFNFEH